MKVIESISLIAAGSFPYSREWKNLKGQVVDAIIDIDWPPGSGSFTINPKKHGNGVKPIKEPCLQKLEKLGWKREILPPNAKVIFKKRNELDALYSNPPRYVGFEWETGNISSSHRAVNKLMLALHKGILVGGFLAVPSDKLYPYLTDRVGNIRELRPYFPLWKSIPVKEAALEIIVYEHDGVSGQVPTIAKGTEGRALK